MDEDQDNTVDPARVEETIAGRIERVILNLSRTADTMRIAAQILSFGPERLVPIYYGDESVRIALPNAEFEFYQQRLLERRRLADDLLYNQLFDVLPDMRGKEIIDVGSYTGATAMVMAKILRPSHIHMFEAQKSMMAALKSTIAANDCDNLVSLHNTIIDEQDQPIALGLHRPDRLAETIFVRRENGKLRSRSLDSFDFGPVGLIHLDFNHSKMPLLFGAEALIRSQRPVICLDLMGRDMGEIRDYLEGKDYLMQRAGAFSAFFIPK